MISFYMDENVPRAITEGLRRRGVNVRTVQEDGLQRLPDTQVLDRAGELGRVLVSQDTDLLIIAAERQRRGELFAGVLYAPQKHANIGRYVDDLELIALLENPEDYRNGVRYLPL